MAARGVSDEQRETVSRELTAILEQSTREEEVQQFLSAHPWVLLDCFTFPWAVRECFPKFKLGNELVTDYLLVSGQSFRYELILVELEPPSERLFTKAGVPAARLAQAAKQVIDWNAWVASNHDFLRRELARALRARDREVAHQERWLRELKYGANQIESASFECVSFKIVIGRRSSLTSADNKRRASYCNLLGGQVEIVTYDRLIQAAASPTR